MPRFILTAAAALALGGLLLTACELEEAETPAASPDTAAAETPTSEPASTPEPTPTDETPGPTMTAGGRAPDGCLDTEKAYIDPDGRFAFCYPAEMEVAQADTGAGVAANVRDPAAIDDLHIVFGLRVEPYSPCGIDTDAVVRNQRVEPFRVNGETVEACFKDHFDPGQPDILLFKTIDFQLMTADARSAVVLATYSEDATRDGVPVEEILQRILDSITSY